MEKLRPFIIVADDGGHHPAIDQGVRIAIEQKAITCADYIIEKETSLAATMLFRNEFPNINLGLHVVIPGINDFLTNAIAYWCRFRPNKLFQNAVVKATERQIKTFQDIIGKQPAHLSTHAHLHLDHSDNAFPWFVDLISRLSEGSLSTMVVRGIHTVPIRHARAREMITGKKPLSPSQFLERLSSLSTRTEKPIELVVHPAKKTGKVETPFRSIYTMRMRQHDLQSLIEIVESGVIEQAGYQIVPAEKLWNDINQSI